MTTTAESTPAGVRPTSLVLRVLLGAAGLVTLFSFGIQLWVGPLLIPLTYFAARKSQHAGQVMFSALAAVLFGQVLVLAMATVVDDTVLALGLTVPPMLAFWVVFHRSAVGNPLWHQPA